MLSSFTVYEQVHVLHGQDDAHTTHTVNMTAMHELTVATNQKPEETKMLTMVTLLQQCLKEMSSEKSFDSKRTAEYVLSPRFEVQTGTGNFKHVYLKRFELSW